MAGLFRRPTSPILVHCLAVLEHLRWKAGRRNPCIFLQKWQVKWTPFGSICSVSPDGQSNEENLHSVVGRLAKDLTQPAGQSELCIVLYFIVCFFHHAGGKSLCVIGLFLLFLCYGQCKQVPNLGSNNQSTKERGAQYFSKVTAEWHQKLRKSLDEKALNLRPSYHSPASRPTTTDSGDKAAMEALYTATNGPTWVNNTGWMKGDPCNPLWHGLYCAGGRILQINLVYNNMTGSLPAKLAEATTLQVARFYSNFLTGPLPQEILQMKSLQILDVNDNEITGPFPGSVIMPNLTDLILYKNQIKGTFPDLTETPMLQTLEISSNIFMGDFPDISRCTKLQILIASNNNFTGNFPGNMQSLSGLQQFWLFNNQFDKAEIPESWSSLVSLTDVQLSGVSGELPSYIGQVWTNLVHLVMIDGDLTGEFDTGLCSLHQLQDLRLFGNRLSGQLPTCLCDMSSVQTFEMSDNQLTGSIPYCIGSLTELATFYLSRNNLTGTLPESIGSLAKLEIMDLSSNAITGTVPSSYAGLTGIVGFSLCYNKLYKLEPGLEPLYDRIKGFSCELYNNPWSCPLPTDVPANCQATCSKCNTGSKRTDCSECVADADCGWCNEGPNCLEGSQSGPYVYVCKSGDWSYGSGTC